MNFLLGRKHSLVATTFTAIAFIVISIFTSTASAHEVRPAFLKITELENNADFQIFEASFRQPQINGRFLGLVATSNCASENLSASISEGALIEVSQLNCDEAGITSIEIEGLDRTLIDTLVSINWLDGSITNHLITAQAGSLDLDSALPTLPVYLSVGLKHLLLGFDHILFVLMLMCLVRKPLEIVLVISSFTVAHSITLGLAAFSIVSLSQPPVEAVIAASIVLLAYEILQNKKTLSSQFPVLIAFAFGLLHGLGFAGALLEIGLPENSRLMALLLFNVGIELGQLAIVGVVLGALTLSTIKLSTRIQHAPVYMAGGVASFWFMERAWQIFLPVFI